MMVGLILELCSSLARLRASLFERDTPRACISLSSSLCFRYLPFRHHLLTDHRLSYF